MATLFNLTREIGQDQPGSEVLGLSRPPPAADRPARWRFLALFGAFLGGRHHRSSSAEMSYDISVVFLYHRHSSRLSARGIHWCSL